MSSQVKLVVVTVENSTSPPRKGVCVTLVDSNISIVVLS